MSNLTASLYFKLIRASFTHPKEYLSSVKNYTSTKDALAFFIINITLGALIKAAGDIFYYQNPVGIFLSITEISIFIPVACLGLIMISTPLHLIAKVLSGKGDFKVSIKSVCYSTSPLIFLWVPVVAPLVLIYIIYLMISNFHQNHFYTINKSIVNILIPFLLVLIASSLLNSY